MYKAGIVGYGNVGKGVEAALLHAEDMQLAGVFSRRADQGVCSLTGAPVRRLGWRFAGAGPSFCVHVYLRGFL